MSTTQNKQDFYQYLRERIRNWAASVDGRENKWVDYLLFAPDIFHLLWKLTTEEKVPTPDKTKLLLVIAYFISPIDFIPEAIFGPFGFIDDLALAAYALNQIVNNASPELLRKHWAGDEDVLDIIQRILYASDEMLGSGLWKKLKHRFF